MSVAPLAEYGEISDNKMKVALGLAEADAQTCITRRTSVLSRMRRQSEDEGAKKTSDDADSDDLDDLDLDLDGLDLDDDDDLFLDDDSSDW